jgi:DNA-binding MarR family transcriptional regulator
LWEQEGQSQVQLAERTFKDKPNVSRMIEVLEKGGVVYRRQKELDRRAYEVFLTDKGRKLRNDTVPLAVQVLERALAGLDAEQIEQFKKTLAHIDSNLA